MITVDLKWVSNIWNLHHYQKYQRDSQQYWKETSKKKKKLWWM